jgi:hypothetical protein
MTKALVNLVLPGTMANILVIVKLHRKILVGAAVGVHHRGVMSTLATVTSNPFL